MVDYIRTCYVEKMKVWQDREPIEVRWFRAPPGARLLPGPHPFGSMRTWDKGEFNSPQYPGEHSYVRYDKGENPIGYKGEGYCGPDVAIQEGGKTGRDPIITTEADGWSPCCGPRETVTVCGVVLPKRMLLTLTPGGANCPCGVGATATLEYRNEAADWFGYVADHWWVLPGLPFPFVAEFTPWFDSPHHVQLGTCAVANYTLYLYPLYAINSDTCQDKLFFGIYQHFNPPFDQTIRFKTWGEAAAWQVIQGPPFRIEGLISSHQNDSICDFTDAAGAAIDLVDAGP